MISRYTFASRQGFLVNLNKKSSFDIVHTKHTQQVHDTNTVKANAYTHLRQNRLY